MAITISGENNNDKILASDGVIDQISGINIVGVLTATTFIGNLTGNVTGNLTGNVNSTSPLLLQTGGSERFRITGNNELGIAGANYGTSGQVLTSGGSGSAVSWTTIPTQVTISSNANNRIITGGSGTNLVGEANLTWDGSVLSATGSDAQLRLYDSTASSENSAFRLMAYNGVNMIQSGKAFSSDSKADLVFGSMFGGSEFLRLKTNGRLEINTNGDLYIKGSGYNSTLNGNILSFDRPGYSYIQNSHNSGSLNFRVTASNTIALRLDNSAQAIFPQGVLFLGTANTSSGHLNAYETMTFNIDTDNDDTNRYFAFYKDGASGSGTKLLSILEDGKIVMGSSTTSTTQLDIRFTDTTAYSATSNHPNGLKIFNDSNTDNGFAGIELAATDGDDYYGSTLLKSIADGTNYSNDFVIQTRHAGNYAERLRINSDGNVKIGSGTPGAKFHVEDSNSSVYNSAATTGAASVYLVNTASNGPFGIILQNASTNGTNTCQATIHSVAEGTDKNTALTFGTRQNSDATIRERLRIASTGNVSIGTENVTEGVLQVAGDITAGILHGGRMYGLLAKRKFDGNNSLGGFAMEYASGYESPYIVAYNNTGSPSANNITFGSLTTSDRNLNTGLTKLVEINANSGNTTLNTGNLVIGTSGRGIDFSATANAGNTGSMTSELLDDYEEGSWTPSLGNVGTISYSHQIGRYTKIGRLVHFVAYVRWDSRSNNGSYNITYTGLPFSSGNFSGYLNPAIHVGGIEGLSGNNSNRTHVGGNVYNSSTTGQFRVSNTTGLGEISLHGGYGSTGAGYIYWAGSYYTS